MRYRNLLWWLGGWWLLPAGVGLVLFYTNFQRYVGFTNATADAVFVKQSILFLLPVWAARAAWLGNRIRAFQPWHLSTSTRRLVFVSQVTVSMATIGLLSQAMVLTGFGHLKWQLSLGSLGLAFESFSALLAVSLVGLLLGIRLRSFLSLPASSGLAVASIMLPLSLGANWQHHLVGTHLSCCNVSSYIPGQIHVAATMSAISIIGISLMAIARPKLKYCLAGIAISVLSLITGNVIAFKAPASGVAPRADSELICRGESRLICTFPENEDLHSEIVQIANQTFAPLERVGLKFEGVFTESSSVGEDEYPLYVDREHLLSAMPRSLITSVVESPTDSCLLNDPSRSSLMMDEYEMQVHWLLGVAGIESNGQISQTVKNGLKEIADFPISGQIEWFQTHRMLIIECNQSPQ